MVIERPTYERAVQIEEQMRARGFTFIQAHQRRVDILRAAGLPIIGGPRPVHARREAEGGNVYTIEEAAEILRHHNLCWHEREAILKRGADRKAPWTMEARRAYWAACLTALALGAKSAGEPWCVHGIGETRPHFLGIGL